MPHHGKVSPENCLCRHRVSIYGESGKCRKCKTYTLPSLASSIGSSSGSGGARPGNSRQFTESTRPQLRSDNNKDAVPNPEARIREIEREIEEEAKGFEARQQRNSPGSFRGVVNSFVHSALSARIASLAPPSTSSASSVLRGPPIQPIIPNPMLQLNAQLTEFEMIMQQYKAATTPPTTRLQLNLRIPTNPLPPGIIRSGGKPRIQVATTVTRPMPPPLPIKVQPPLSKKTVPVLPEKQEDEDEDKQCVVCLERNKSHILIPCGHYAYCEQCAMNLKICALCRVKVKKRVKVFEA